jgi:hypothetical protein
MMKRILPGSILLAALLVTGPANAQVEKNLAPQATSIRAKAKSPAKHHANVLRSSLDRDHARLTARDIHGVQKSGGPPANDNCGGAINLVVGASCSPTVGDVSGATQSIPSITCNTFTGVADNDVWYMFTATATTATIEVTGSVDLDAVVDLRSGVCNGTNIACADATVEGETETINAAGLTVGAVYYIRVYDYYTGLPTSTTFEICVYGGATAPVNDECANATVLTMGATCTPTTGTTAAATQSIPAITCATFTGDANDDVWYQFVATATNATIEVQGSAGFDAVVDLRSGACTGTNIDCADATIDGGLEMIPATGLTIGNTYYVRVYHWATAAPTTSTFDICVYDTPPAPPNDDCGDVTAVALPIGGSIDFTGDNTGATSVNEGPFSAYPTVWHAFTLASCADVTIAYCGTTPAFANVWVSLSTDCPSTSFTDALSFNDTDCPDGNITMLYEDLAVGTYWLPILQEAGSTGPYTIEVSAVDCASAGVPNDLCGDVVPASLAVPGSVNFSGDNTNSTSAGDAVAGTILDVGGDTTTVWHAFTITDCADLAVSYCGTLPLPDVYWAVLTLDCPADDDVIFFSSGNFTDCVDGNATIFFTNVPAGTYYLPVRGEPSTWGPYTIEVTASPCAAVPVNDDCGDAIGLAVNLVSDCPANATPGNNANSTQDAGDPSCDTTTGEYLDNWYTFFSGPNTTITITFDAGTMGDWVIVLYDACAGTEVAGSCTITPAAPFDLTVNTNTTYWVRVYSNTQYGVGGTYNICLSAGISTGISSTAAGGMAVFPNPTSGRMTITGHGFDGMVNIEVIDATGRSAYQERRMAQDGSPIELDLAGRLALGSYTVRLSDAARTISQPLLVK